MRSSLRCFSRALALLVLAAGAPALAERPCEDCWTDACLELRGVFPACAKSAAPRPRPRPAPPPPTEAPRPPLQLCRSLEECNGRCSAGDMVACVTLGTMFNEGINVVADKAKAAFWYSVACDGGSAVGCQFKKELALETQRAEEAARREKEQREREEAERSKRTAEQRQRDEQARREAEARAAVEEVARRKRLCEVPTPFLSEAATQVPFKMAGELVDPSYCGLGGRMQWTFPIELRREERVHLRLNRACDGTAADCYLYLPSGQSLTLSEEDLKGVLLGAGRNVLVVAGKGSGGVLALVGTPSKACNSNDANPATLTEGKSLVFTDDETGCVMGERAGHFFTIRHLAEKAETTTDYDVVLTLQYENFGLARRPQPASPADLVLYDMTKPQDGVPTRVDPSRLSVRGRTYLLTAPPSGVVSGWLYKQGDGVVRKLSYKSRYRMSADFFFGARGSLGSVGAEEEFAGGVSLQLGATWQLLKLLSLDFGAMARIFGSDLGFGVLGQPLMVALRVGERRHPQLAPMWARVGLGPVFRTLDTDKLPVWAGLSLRADWQPFNGVGAYLGAEANFMANGVTEFFFDFGFGIGG